MNNRPISSRNNPPIMYGTTVLVNEKQKVDAAAKFMSSVIGRKDPNSQKERDGDESQPAWNTGKR
jgi:hypothetical protein